MFRIQNKPIQKVEKEKQEEFFSPPLNKPNQIQKQMADLPLKSKNPKLSLVRPMQATALADLRHKVSATTEIDALLERLPDRGALKFEISFVLFVCNLVENITSIKLTGAQKKALVIEKIRNYFDDWSEEMLSKTIDFLCTASLVSKIPTVKMAAKTVGSKICGFF